MISKIFDFNDFDINKKKNVIVAYADTLNISNIVYVIDDTIFSSCKDVAVLTDKYLCIK